MKKTNKIISILLVLAMLLSMAPLSLTASAAPDTDYTGYYKITNAGNLAWFACLVVGDTSQSSITEAEPDAKAVLAADIDITVLAETLGKSWVGIGTEEIPFTGVFDGNGYTIKGLTTDTSLTKSSVATVAVDSEKQGLFGVIGEGGVVRDVIVEGTANLSDTIKYGGICSENNGTIENVLSMITVTGGDNADVFCHTNNGTITNSFANQTTSVASGVTTVDAATLAGGSVAYALGASFGQTIGTDTQPVHFNGDNTIYKDGDIYTNTLHTHSFTYTASVSGDRIVATCTADGCPLENGDGGYITISAPADLYVDGNAKEAVVDNQLADTSVTYEVIYSTADGAAPKTAGTYTASVTLGDATASVEFTLLNYVASVTDKDGNSVGNYTTFADAITAAKNSAGSTLTLLDNTEGVYAHIVSPVTLDLNGYTLDMGDDNIFVGSVLTGYDPHVTLTDTSEAGTGKIKGSYFYGVFNMGYSDSPGKLTVQGGTIEYTGTQGAISLKKNGTVEMSGGSIKSTASTISIANYQEDFGGSVNISGGSFPDGLKILVNSTEYTSTEQYLADLLAEGCYFYNENGNKITVADDATEITGYVQVKEYFAASVTDKDGNTVGTYKTFADAVTAAEGSEGSTLTLLDDITLTEKQNINSGKFTLDLNGKTLLNETGNTLLIESGADVTIKDSGEGGTVKSGGATAGAIFNEGTLTVESGYLVGGGSGVSSSGTLTINGGTFEGMGNSVYITGGTVEIYDGTFNGNVWGFAPYTINGGDFTAEFIGINCEGGVLTVKGGTFDIDKIQILKGTVSLKGGEFTNGFTVTDLKYDSDAEQFAATILADGCNYYDANGNKITVADDATEITGYVRVKEYFAASVTDKDGSTTNYRTFADAVTAASASEGSTLTLLDDITLTATQYISSGKFTLDLNGKTLFCETTITLRVKSGADVTIKDSGEGGTVETGGESSSAIFNYGTLTVESGTVTGSSGIYNIGTLTFNGGTAETSYYAAITNAGTAYVYGGKLLGTGECDGIENNSNGILYVYDGEISGDAAITNFGIAYIEGGKFTGNGYAALNLLRGTVEITGGSFTGKDNENGYYFGVPYGEWTVYYTDSVTLTLKGGEFPNGFTVSGTNANTFLATGYYYKDADGKLITVADDATVINGYVKVSKGADLADAVITLSQTEYEYNGGENKPSVTVTVGGKTLDSANYTVSYADNINAGKATVTVTAVESDIYSGTATANFTITKAEISVTAPTANTLTYNGSAQSLITAGSANIGEMQYSTDGATYSADIPVGTNAGDYTVYYKVVGDANHNDTEPATVTVTIKTKDISDGSIILGDALTYNGTEQTQTVTTVEIPDDLDVTYDISGNKATNVGVYLLTVTGNGNFSGEAMIAYEIAPDTTSIDALTTENVTSADKASIEAVKAQIDNAVTDLADDAKKAEYQAIADKCVELLKMIESVADKLESFKNELAGYDIDTVTSDDADDLESFYNEVAQVYNDYFDNLTEAETKEFDNILSGILALQKRISDVANEITRITDAVNGYDKATVKSSDKADIEKLIEDIKALTDGQNITDEERTNLENLDATADALLAKIAETTAEYDRVIAAANGYDEATVTSADKDALVQLNEDIYALALTDNVTADELENLENAHDKVLGLIDKLTGISDEIKRIIEAVDKYVFESVKSSDKADIQQLIADIKALLDTQNITADERTLLEGADETCDKLIAKIDETVAEVNRINDATNAYDIDTVTSADRADIEQLFDDSRALTDGDNLTDTEREQLNGNETTLKALLDKIGATADEIERIENAVNSYDEATVKSTDKADLEQLIEDIKALTDATNITEDERTALAELDAKVDSLIKKIDDTAAEIARIDEAVNAYDEASVKSSDEEAINQLKEDIQTLIDGDNLTEEEKAALEETKADADALADKIDETQAEIDRINDAVNSYTEDTVKSTDTEAIEQLKEDIQSLIDSGNVTEEEIAALEDTKADADALTDKITETEEQLEEIKGIENNYNPENVSSDDKADIEAAIAEIEAVNPDNLTDEQKAEYEEIKAEFEALLNEIEAAEKSVADIGVELEMFDEDRVTIFWEDDIEALKAKIDELLADENMGEAEKAKLNEYKAQAEKLIEIINTPKEYFSLRFFYLIWDCLTWKYNGILWLFSKIFGFEPNATIA